jgi:Fe-S-cluster containining protein
VIADDTTRPAFARAAPDAPAHEPTQDSTQDWDDMCRSCGACCAYSADWPRFSLESEAELAKIPREFVDDAERGTRCVGNRCAALEGVVGRATACAIYAVRPHVCRECMPGDGACLEARRHFGL